MALGWSLRGDRILPATATTLGTMALLPPVLAAARVGAHLIPAGALLGVPDPSLGGIPMAVFLHGCTPAVGASLPASPLQQLGRGWRRWMHTWKFGVAPIQEN